MNAAWQAWLKRNEMRMAIHSVQPETLNELDENVRESVHRSLLEYECNLANDPQPMLALRRELMDSIDRHQLNVEILNLSPATRAHLRTSHPEILQTDDAAHTYILANELRIAVLRLYAGLSYGDCDKDDWFAVYQKASRLRQRGTRNYIERAVAGAQQATDEVRFQTMSVMDNEIRKRLLQVPAGTRFPGFDKTAQQSSEPA